MILLILGLYVPRVCQREPFQEVSIRFLILYYDYQLGDHPFVQQTTKHRVFPRQRLSTEASFICSVPSLQSSDRMQL